MSARDAQGGAAYTPLAKAVYSRNSLTGSRGSIEVVGDDGKLLASAVQSPVEGNAASRWQTLSRWELENVREHKELPRWVIGFLVARGLLGEELTGQEPG